MDAAVGVERVVGRDALAASVKDGRVARHLVPNAEVGVDVKGGV